MQEGKARKKQEKVRKVTIVKKYRKYGSIVLPIKAFVSKPALWWQKIENKSTISMRAVFNSESVLTMIVLPFTN